MAAWAALITAVILLVAFGSKISAAVSCIILTVAAKCGLLSNVRVGGGAARISIRVSAIRISFWECLWAFLHAPTQTHLFCIEVPEVHVHVVRLASACDAKTAPLPPQQELGDALTQLAAMLDLAVSLKSTQHAVWSPIRAWIHRLSVVCYFVHLVALRVNSISIDIENESGEATRLATVSHGSAHLRANYNSEVDELLVALAISHGDSNLQCCVPSVDGSIELGPTELRVWIPVSRGVNDHRAPIPTSCLITCDALSTRADVELCTRLSSSVSGGNKPRSTDIDAATHGDVRSCSLLVLRLVEALPDEIGFLLRKLELRLCGGSSAESDDCVCVLSNLSLRVANPSIRLLGGRAAPSDGSLSEERKVSLELGALCLRVDTPVRELPPALALDALKVDLEVKLTAACSETASAAADEALDAAAALSCCARVSSEIRGLSITVHAEFAPWISRMHTELERQKRDAVLYVPVDELKLELDLSEPHPLWESTVIELEIQLKALQTEIFLESLDSACAVLRTGVPSVQITAEEVNVFAHPFVGEQTLGVRSKADIQCSRLKILSCDRAAKANACFISLDFARVFIEPMSLMNANQSPAEVEMEAEWLEVKWTPQALHAIGGMLELGIFVAAAFLKEDATSAVEWSRDAKSYVQPLKTLEDVSGDRLSGSEAVKFRCTVKRVLVLFAYSIEEQSHLDYVTVESLTMSVEETTGRFRISVCQTKVYYVAPDEERSFASPTFANQRPPRRSSSMYASKRAGGRQPVASAATRGRHAPDFQRAGSPDTVKTARPYFTVQSFALEESKLPQCPKTVVDIFVDAVHGDWDIATQLRVMELVRKITYSTWEMLYVIRRGYAVSCTASESRYNRPGGINPPMDDAAECARCAGLLDRLVSATGDTLNRLHATNVSLSARISSDTHMQLRIGVFGGDDMPDLWTFRVITLQLNALRLLTVDSVRVRHTIEKRRDYVFGEFEEMLSLRMAACGKRAGGDTARRDGMLVDVAGARVRLSTQVPLLRHIADAHAHFAPFERTIETAMAAHWRPQHDVFFQYFLRSPMTPGRPQLWLSVADVVLECLDAPLESWLEHMYPLWLEELQEQELRAQVLDDQVMTLKLTNADMLCDDAYDDMKALLVEKSAKIYVQKARKLRAKCAVDDDANGDVDGVAASGTLFSVRIGHIAADVSFEGSERETLRRMRELDEASASVAKVFDRYNRDFDHYVPLFELLEGIALNVAIENVAVRTRNFATPLLVCSQIDLSGHVIVAASKGAAGRGGSGSGDGNGDDGATPISSLEAGLRTFMDLSVSVAGPLAFFSPSYLYTLDEIAGLARDLLPLLVFDVDRELETPPWDILRRLMHGKVRVSVQDAALRLLCSATSFVSSDYLEVALGRLQLDYAFDKTVVNLHRLTAKIDPGALTNLVEFSNVHVEVWTKWMSAGGDSAVHFGFPLEYRTSYSEDKGRSSDCVVLDAWASRILTPEQWRASQIALSDRHPLKHYEATGLSIFVRGTVCPWSADTAGAAAQVSTIKRTKHEVATRTAIVLYTKHIEWLIRFASLYRTLPQFSFPRRRRQQRAPSATLLAPSASLLRIFKALVVENFTVLGLDLAVHHSEKNPIGIRAFVNDQVAISGAVLTATHELFQAPLTQAKRASKPRRLSVPFNNQMWVVHDATIAVQDIQVRVCTRTSGSRGESLVSVKHMTLKVGGGSEVAPTHDDSVARSTASLPDPAPEMRTESASGGKSSGADARVRTKKNILEHFAIAQHNPYCFRDSDADPQDGASTLAESAASGERHYQANFVEEFRRLGFLMGLSAREARILVTIGAVEALVDIVENWIRIVTVCIPELLGVSDDIAAADSSPKKITSLTEDPKFGAIFYESVVRDECNSFVTRLAPPSFLAGDVSSATTPGSADSSSAVPPTAANIVESFFMVTFMDCQVSVQDHSHKGSVLLALNCGTLKDSISSDACHELIDLKVDGLQLFTAPLDIDVKSRIVWIKTLADGSYCPSSHGLLQQVIAPIPTKVVIWIDRNATVLNKVDLQIPTIQVGLNVASKDILQNLATALSDAIAAKVSATGGPDYSKMLHGSARMSGYREGAHSIASLCALKKELKWKIAELQWRQVCRWSYYVSERANVAFAAAENSRSLTFEMETSPLFRRRKVSSASVSSIGTSNMSMSGTGTIHGDVDQHADELQRLTQQLESTAETLHSMVKTEQKKTQALPNVELEFHLQSASLTLSAANMDIVRVAMSSLRFKMKQFEDQSGCFTLTLQDLSTQNLCPGTPYPDLLQASATSSSWGGGNAFVRIDAEVAAPVGGITVVKHFEVNLHPLQVCITQEVILHLVAFFTSAAASDSSQDEKRDEVRSTFLQARPAGVASDGLVGSALKKAAKVAGKAAHPLGLGKSHRDDGDSAPSGSSAGASARRSRSFTMIHDDASARAMKAAADAAAAGDLGANETQLLLRSDDDDGDSVRAGDVTEREVSEMRGRAKTNILFKRIRIGTVEVAVTYKHKKRHQKQNHQALEDMRGFEVKVHALVYCDKTCSLLDLLLRIRRDVILDVLSQVGRNFTNIATFLRDQVDLTRWGQFDALAPLKTLSTTVSSSLASVASPTASSVAPAPIGATGKTVVERSPRTRAATAPSASAAAAASAQDTTGTAAHHKFQLELPESHRSLRKKHTTMSVRAAETVSKGVSGGAAASPTATGPSPTPSPRRDGGADDSDGDHHHTLSSSQPRHHRSTAGKAKHAIAHLFSKKRAGGSPSLPLSPAKAEELPVSGVAGQLNSAFSQHHQ